MKVSIGTTLKNARKNAGLTVKEVRYILLENNIDVAEKTIYGWENDYSVPNIHTFLLLCKCYGVKDILRTFGYKPAKRSKVLYFLENEYTKEELDDIRKYAEFLKNKRNN